MPERLGQFRRAVRPLGSAQTVFLVDRCADSLSKSLKLCHRARSDDIVSPSTRSALAQTILTARSSNSAVLWRKSARKRRGSTSVTGPSARQATTIPGNRGPRTDVDP